MTTPMSFINPPQTGKNELLKPTQLHHYQKSIILFQLYNPWSAVWSFMGSGKLQPNSEPILTPSGWSTMGNIETGDFVIGSNGHPVLVTETFKHPYKKIYKVKFNDGSFTRCGGEHLWYVETASERFRNKKGSVLSTDEIIEKGVIDKQGNKRFSIPMMKPVQYSPVNLNIDPYLLGVILGDGTISKWGGITLCTDLEIIEACELKFLKMHESSSITAYASIPGINSEIKKLNLVSKRSWEKHVPSDYLIASPLQRLSLLQGLLDTDGYTVHDGGVEFSSTSENLIDSVVELAQSLGGIGRKSKPRNTKYQTGEGRTSWRVNVKLPSDLEPFRLKRKIDKWVRPSKYKVTRYISEIVEDSYEDSKCISVDSEDNLYVTRNFILTHNTICTLSSTVHRMQTGEVQKTLIVAPLRVCTSVWEKEARKWEHTKHLTFSLIHGDEKMKSHALFTEADIYLINYEGLTWLVEKLLTYYLDKGDPLPFQSVVYDEISKLKNAQSVRFSGGKRESEDKNGNPFVIITKGWKKIANHFTYRTGLTGTPVSNGYLDLFGQYLVLDGGERLGKFITHYRNNYFVSDYMGWSYTPSELGKQAIEAKIKDITLSMVDGSKYLDLPKVTYSNIVVTLPKKARLHYNEIEKELFTQLDSGIDIELFNASSVANKLLQICNGSAYYDLEGHWELIHKAKLDALEEVLEEAAGSPVLCAYNYKSDAQEIMKRFKKYKPVNITTEKGIDSPKILEKWNNNRIKLMIGHPASCGHGLDSLQDSGSIVVWFGLNYSLELYQQLNARIDRQGQKKPVSIIHILAENTMDFVVLDILENKNSTQQNLTDSIKRYRG